MVEYFTTIDSDKVVVQSASMKLECDCVPEITITVRGYNYWAVSAEQSSTLSWRLILWPTLSLIEFPAAFKIHKHSGSLPTSPHTCPRTHTHTHTEGGFRNSHTCPVVTKTHRCITHNTQVYMYTYKYVSASPNLHTFTCETHTNIFSLRDHCGFSGCVCVCLCMSVCVRVCGQINLAGSLRWH